MICPALFCPGSISPPAWHRVGDWLGQGVPKRVPGSRARCCARVVMPTGRGVRAERRHIAMPALPPLTLVQGKAHVERSELGLLHKHLHAFVSTHLLVCGGEPGMEEGTRAPPGPPPPSPPSTPAWVATSTPNVPHPGNPSSPDLGELKIWKGCQGCAWVPHHGELQSITQLPAPPVLPRGDTLGTHQAQR